MIGLTQNNLNEERCRYGLIYGHAFSSVKGQGLSEVTLLIARQGNDPLPIGTEFFPSSQSEVGVGVNADGYWQVSVAADEAGTLYEVTLHDGTARHKKTVTVIRGQATRF